MSDILQIMPAPGWRVFQCRLEDGAVQFNEVPVVGWGIVERNDDKEVDLLVYIGYVRPIRKVNDSKLYRCILLEVPPGEEPDRDFAESFLQTKLDSLADSVKNKPAEQPKERCFPFDGPF